MQFEVGKTIVYPHHGPAKILEVKKRKSPVKHGDGENEEQTWLHLHVDQGDLKIWVPAENVELVGIRDVIGPEALEQVFETLRTTFTEESSNWSRRYKANQEKLASGDVIKVSEVVRDLWRRDREVRALSPGEKSILVKARQILVSELALAKKIDEEEAGRTLDEVLAS